MIRNKVDMIFNLEVLNVLYFLGMLRFICVKKNRIDNLVRKKILNIC